jgi:hypothetical protein
VAVAVVEAIRGGDVGDLADGEARDGPAIVVEPFTTVLVPREAQVALAPSGSSYTVTFLESADGSVDREREIARRL